MIRRTVLAAALAALAAAPAAQAADPFTAGTGADPKVAVSPNGTGHVVFNDTTDAVHNLEYCRIPKGGSACDLTKDLTFPAAPGAQDYSWQPQVFAVSDSKIVVTGSCWTCGGGNRTYKFVSTNGGADFTPTLLAQTSDAEPTVPTAGSQAAWNDSLGTGTLLVTGGRRFQAMTPGVTGNALLHSCPDGICGYRPATALIPGTARVVSATSDLNLITYAVSKPDATPTAAELNDVASWDINKDLAPGEDADEPTLASNVGGLFVAYRQFVPNDNQFRVRKFDPATGTFGAGVSVQGGDPIDNSVEEPALFQDASGRLHGVYRTISSAGNRLRYVSSTDGGATWAAGFSLAKGETYQDPEVAAAADGSGFAVFQNGTSGPIRVLRLDPYADVTPPPVVTPPVVTPPKTTPPDPAVVGYAGPTYLGTLKPTTAKVDGATVSFGTPRTCVKPGQKFKVTLTWKKQRRKGNRFVKVRRSDFYIATKRVKVDRKAPFTQTLTVTASTKPGATVRLRARAFIKVSRGKSPTKSVFASIKVCG